MTGESRPTTLSRRPPNGRLITITELLCKEPTLGFLDQGSCTGKTRSRHLPLKPTEACMWERQGAVGNRDSTLKGCMQILTHS